MLSNEEIKRQLNKELEKAIAEFKGSDHNQDLNPGFEKLLNFDFESYKTYLKKEIRNNLKMH